MPVNWCEELGTVLSNDEVIDGKSERGGYPVVRKNMKQWVIDQVAFADKLREAVCMSEGEYKKMSQNAYEYGVKKYSAEGAIDRFVKVIFS